MMTPTLLHTVPPAPTLGLFASHQPPSSLSGIKLEQGCPFSRIGNRGSKRVAVECHLCVTQHSWGMVGQAQACLPEEWHALGPGELPTLLP